jgi:hypothetical protein
MNATATENNKATKGPPQEEFSLSRVDVLTKMVRTDREMNIRP